MYVCSVQLNVHGRRNGYEFLVRWTSGDETWNPASAFLPRSEVEPCGAAKMIYDFIMAYNKRLGKGRRQAENINLTGELADFKKYSRVKF